MAFVIPAALGLLWLLPWLAIFPDKDTMAAVSHQAGGSRGGPSRLDVPLGQLLANHKVLGLLLIRVFTGPITTFYWTWLPLYLRNGRGMTLFATGLLASVPNLIGMGGNVIGGIFTDRFVKAMGSSIAAARSAFVCAFSLGALSMTMPLVANNYAGRAADGPGAVRQPVVRRDLHRHGRRHRPATARRHASTASPASATTARRRFADSLTPARSSTSTDGRACSSARACCRCSPC